MMNVVVLTGRLTTDPELRYTQNGNPVSNFTLAVNRSFKNADGENEADFINCVIWNKQAETVANYLSKGSLIGVQGNIQTRTYDNNEGKRIYVTEVYVNQFTFLESKKEETHEKKPITKGNQKKQYQKR